MMMAVMAGSFTPPMLRAFNMATTTPIISTEPVLGDEETTYQGHDHAYSGHDRTDPHQGGSHRGGR